MSESFELTIDSLAAGGDGVGRDAEGRVVFVPATAPGDRVAVEVVEGKKSFARAELRQLLAPGPERVEPRCAYFTAGTCGGCQWQHVSASAQAAAKQAIVANALRAHIAAGLELAPVAAPVPPYGWRRRARLHWVRPRKAARAIVGLYPPRSHRVTEIERCPQLEPALDAALAEVRSALAPALTGKGEIDLVAGHEGRVHVVIRGPCSPAAAEALAATEGIAGVALGKRRFGATAIELEPGFAGRADHFAQASQAGNQALIDEVDRATGPRDGLLILEVFAGSGNLTRTLAEGAARVIAIDRQPAPPSLPEAVEYRQGDAGEQVRIQRRKGDPVDLVVLDPPRTGAGALIDDVAALGAARVVYVSCDPATLARDAGRLVDRGYRAVAARALDLMPQTAHIEVVMTFERHG